MKDEECIGEDGVKKKDATCDIYYIDMSDCQQRNVIADKFIRLSHNKDFQLSRFRDI